MDCKNYILPDSDGTLTDPKEGITKSVQHALTHFEMQTDDLDSLTSFIGPPLGSNFKKYHGFSDEQAWERVQAYRKYFSVGDWIQDKEYPNIKGMLEVLKEAGKVLLMATSKPEKFARKTLEHFGMVNYFDFIGEADMEEVRVRKGGAARYVLERCDLELDSRAIGRCMVVGGKEHGILGTRKRGMECVGVLYGYGDHREMNGCRLAWVAGTMKKLRGLLLSL